MFVFIFPWWFLLPVSAYCSIMWHFKHVVCMHISMYMYERYANTIVSFTFYSVFNISSLNYEEKENKEIFFKLLIFYSSYVCI